MNSRILAALVVAASLMTSAAIAQERVALALTPPDAPRWDVALNAGWLGGNKSEVAPAWDDWYDAASVGASAGYYWTPHLKLELDLATTTNGGIYQQDVIFVPVTYVETREHEFRTTSLAGGLTYQFLENRWFHPFVSGGLAVVHERDRLDLSYPAPRPPGTSTPPPSTSHTTTVSARPFAALGFKAYASPRVFFRTDLQLTASSREVESVSWRGGIGFDF